MFVATLDMNDSYMTHADISDTCEYAGLLVSESRYFTCVYYAS